MSNGKGAIKKSPAKKEQALYEEEALGVTTRQVEGKGWIARAAKLRASASGVTKDEAVNNLRDLIKAYPELKAERRR